MRNWLVTLLLLLAALWMGCANLWQTVRGSGSVITENRQVSGFDGVSVSGGGELILTQDDEEALTIETDDNLLPLIRSEVQGGRLLIGPRNVNLSPTKSIRYQLKLKKLSDLESSGSAQIEADGIKTERLSLSISGSGKVKLAHLETSQLATHISGSGSASVTGHAETQDISISGSGSHDAPDLKSSTVAAHISGSGDASLWVTETLTAQVSGSGSVRYRGAPKVDSRISGSGKVRRDRGE